MRAGRFVHPKELRRTPSLAKLEIHGGQYQTTFARVELMKAFDSEKLETGFQWHPVRSACLS